MRHADHIVEPRDAARRDEIDDALFGNSAGADLARTAEQNALHAAAQILAGAPANPADHRPVEAPAAPPLRIAPGHVHGDLEAAGERLAELVAGHQQPLAGGGAGGMECG